MGRLAYPRAIEEGSARCAPDWRLSDGTGALLREVEFNKLSRGKESYASTTVEQQSVGEIQ